MNRGFSLVELSIVLVILGLLTGGILTGQNLIRAAELRAVTTEQNNFMTAVQTFRDKYFAIPGDMRNATSFWGKDNAACTTDTGTAATPGTCNGDGDGMIDDDGTAAYTTNERFAFWQQLALAGLIEGSYTGLSGPLGYRHHDPDNVPRSKFNNGAWSISYQSFPATAGFYSIDYGNFLRIGGFPTTNNGPNIPIFTPEEGWNIDTKIDDGLPARGKVIAQFWNDLCAAANDGNHTMSNLDASYRLTDPTPQCTMNFIKLY